MAIETIVNGTTIIINESIDYSWLGVIVASVVAVITLYGILSSNKNTKKSNENLEKQLLTSNFEVITNYIGSHVTKECRGIIHNNKKLISQLADEETYKRIKDLPLKRYNTKYNAEHFSETDIDSDTKLRMLLESIRYVCSIYDRVGFLLQENEKLKTKFIPYHKIAIVNIWDKIEKVMQLENKYNKEPKKYPEYEMLVEWCKETPEKTQTWTDSRGQSYQN